MTRATAGWAGFGFRGPGRRDTRALKQAARDAGQPLREFARSVATATDLPRLAGAARAWLARKAAE